MYIKTSLNDVVTRKYWSRMKVAYFFWFQADYVDDAPEREARPIPDQLLG